MSDKRATLTQAIADHVHAGDVLHPVVGHTRWTAATREVVRQWWGRDPGFTLVMLSLSSLGALFFRGELVRKVVTGYSGDTFPNFTPNPWFARAYEAGSVGVEHWSFLAFSQRLEAAAKGLPAIVTRSIAGSSMEANAGFKQVTSPFGSETIGLLEPLAPDVALMHAPLADREGNVVVTPPLLEGVWGALAAKRGVIVTVEKIVDDVRPYAASTRIPAHKVLAVVECPMGAHPGGLFTGALPVDGYGEDYQFWIDARAATRSDEYDAWIKEWVLDIDSQDAWLAKVGAERITALRTKADPDSWRAEAAANPPDLDAPINGWERCAVWGARYLAERVAARGAHAVLAGAGVANLSAWLGVQLARDAGCDVQLTAEIGLWGYDATIADPFVLNHRNFPTATMLGDAQMVLGALVGGAGTTTIGCLGGAQIDKTANINSTQIVPRPFLVGSGGGNDVASTAAENVIVATLTPQRTVEECSYITSPGTSVHALVTDLGRFEKRDGVLQLAALAPGATFEQVQELCGWELEPPTGDLPVLPDVTMDEVAALRRWDPNGWFLRAR